MLLDLTRGPIIHPGRYPTTFVVMLDTDGNPNNRRGRPDCGLFSGHDTSFQMHERNVLCAEIVPEEDRGREPDRDILFADSGVHLFLIDRPERQAQLNETLMYHYVAISFNAGSYIHYPVATEITLTESGGTHLEQDTDLCPDAPPSWWITVGGVGTITLDDYEPGFLTRSTAQALRSV